jgi:hypothetical protein
MIFGFQFPSGDVIPSSGLYKEGASRNLEEITTGPESLSCSYENNSANNRRGKPRTVRRV